MGRSASRCKIAARTSPGRTRRPRRPGPRPRPRAPGPKAKSKSKSGPGPKPKPVPGPRPKSGSGPGPPRPCCGPCSGGGGGGCPGPCSGGGGGGVRGRARGGGGGGGAGVFPRAGRLLGGRLLADSFLAGALLRAGTVFVGWSVMVAGAMSGAGGQPGFAAGAEVAAGEIGLPVVGFEFEFLVVFQFGFRFLVVVPLDQMIALVHVEVFRMRRWDRRSVLPRGPVFGNSLQLDRGVVTAVAEVLVGQRVGVQVV